MIDPLRDALDTQQKEWRREADDCDTMASHFDDRESYALRRIAKAKRAQVDELASLLRSHPELGREPVTHLDNGSDAVCQYDGDDLQFTDHIDAVTCLACLRIAAVSDRAAEPHGCSRCGLTWGIDDDPKSFRLHGEKLCGDCWRKAHTSWSPAYEQYHVRVIETIRARVFARWPPRTRAERDHLEQQVRFFDEQCTYDEPFAANEDPEEFADDEIDAAI